MESYYANLIKYVDRFQLPLHVEEVEVGGHIEKLFHDHSFSEIAIVYHGSARHLVDDHSAPLKTGDLLVIHPGVQHAYDRTGDMGLINIVYDHAKLSMPILDGYSLPLFQTFFPDSHNRPEPDSIVRPVMNLDQEKLDEILLHIRQLQQELLSTRPGNFYYSLSLFMEIMVKLARFDERAQPVEQARFMIGDAVDFMNRNFRQTINIDELARISKMSKRNFFRYFKNAAGCTPLDYLQKIRLNHAVNLLLQTDKSINDIALECGFCDSNYFCRKFREERAISPRRFRQAKRG